jgi:hypothetical protein
MFRLLAHCQSVAALGPIVAASIIVTSAPVVAQYPESNVTPRGVLRISFEPWYINYGRMLDSAGSDIPLGTPLTKDSAGTNFLPSLLAPETAIRSIIDDSTYVLNAGAFTTVQEADIRRFPFNFHFGLTDRITLTASIPIVTTRMQVDFTVDSTNSTMGWNQVAANAGNPTALQAVLSLLGELQAAAAALDAAIEGGGYDCPSGPTCNAARDLRDRTRAMETDVIALTGVSSDGSLATELPPFNPLATSAEGEAIVAAMAALSAELQSFGVAGLTTSLPLPEGRISAEDVNAVLTDSAFGYIAAPLEFNKLMQRLGDVELGVRWGLLQGAGIRTVLSATARLPTGVLDSPSNFIDLGTGDKQLDIEVGLDATFESGVVALGLSGYYNLQLGDKPLRRPADLARGPIAVAAAEQVVSRNLGDEYRIAAYPAIRLHPSFKVYGSVAYYHKMRDKLTAAGTAPEGPGISPPEVLELNSSMKRLSIGGGLYYRSTGREGLSLPIEAGAHYFAAYQGEGGLTPQASGLNFYLRLFWRFYGGEEREPEPEEPSG